VERDAHYTLVGFVALILLVGMVAFLVWLGRWTFNEENDIYEVLFVGSVSGLSEGAEVQFNGIKVGEVRDLSLDAADPNRVIAEVRVGSDVPVRTDSYATIEPLGITGLNFVQITAGTPTNPLLKEVTPDDQVPIIRSQPSILSDLLEGGGTVLARAVEALDQVTEVLNAQNIANFSGVLEDLNILTSEMRANIGVLETLDTSLQDFSLAAQEIAQLSESTRVLVEEDGAEAIADIAGAAEELEATATDMREMIAELRGPTSEFAVNTLPQVQEAIGALQASALSLERLVNEIEQDPRSLLTKEPGAQIEVEP
jgi:phospholipid/cholesterol/gamma-HCH transport system substrate-binding protein